MSVLDDDRRIPPKPLDAWTADRLLDGLIAPDDAPPGYAPVARLVIAARRPASAAELAGLEGAVAAASALLSGGSVDRTEIVDRLRNARRAVRAKIAGLVVVGTIVGTSGLAAAGVLPAPIQSAASRVLDTVGIHVPNPHDDHGSASFATGDHGPSAVAAIASRGHGHDVTDAGRSTDPNHGSHGQHGEHGQAGDHGHVDHPTGKPVDPGSTADDHGQPTDPGSQGHAGGGSGGGGGGGQATPPDQSPNQGGNGGGGIRDHGSDPPADPGQGGDHGQGGGHDQGDGGGGDHGGGNGGAPDNPGGDNGGGGNDDGAPDNPGGDDGGAPDTPGGDNPGGDNGGTPDDPGGDNGGAPDNPGGDNGAAPDPPGGGNGAIR